MRSSKHGPTHAQIEVVTRALGAFCELRQLGGLVASRTVRDFDDDRLVRLRRDDAHGLPAHVPVLTGALCEVGAVMASRRTIATTCAELDTFGPPQAPCVESQTFARSGESHREPAKVEAKQSALRATIAPTHLSSVLRVERRRSSLPPAVAAMVLRAVVGVHMVVMMLAMPPAALEMRPVHACAQIDCMRSEGTAVHARRDRIRCRESLARSAGLARPTTHQQPDRGRAHPHGCVTRR